MTVPFRDNSLCSAVADGRDAVRMRELHVWHADRDKLKYGTPCRHKCIYAPVARKWYLCPPRDPILFLSFPEL